MVAGSRALWRRLVAEVGGLGWRGAWEVVGRFPRRAAYGAAFSGGALSYLLDLGRRKNVQRNLGLVLGREPRPEEVLRCFLSYARYWGEAFALERIPPREILERFSLEGGPRLEAAFREGKGVILAVPHLGNWDVGGAWLAIKGYPLTVVVERLKPGYLFEHFARYRESLGMRVVPSGKGALRRLQEALARREVVALVADRDLSGRGLPVDFFGTRVRLPRGPALLSVRMGAPILTGAVYFSGKGWKGVVGRMLRAEPGELEPEAVARLTQELARAFEDLIRAAPEQWHVFQPLAEVRSSP